ncbi:MAG: hypothetical protein ABSC02_01520 [Acidobacteriota bacterium]|jgi:hypothetical protein
MKKAYLLLAIVLLLAVVVVAGVDFSGTWALNAEKTTAANPAPPAGGGGGGGGGGRGGGGMGGGDMTIKQAGNVLTISRTMGQQGTVDTPYTLDGAEHTNASQMGDTKYKAVLSGNSVHITGTTSSQRGDRPVDTTYALSDDGKTLTVTNVNQGQNGPTTRKQIYDKK